MKEVEIIIRDTKWGYISKTIYIENNKTVEQTMFEITARFHKIQRRSYESRMRKNLNI